jgi:hypothetical protein
MHVCVDFFLEETCLCGLLTHALVVLVFVSRAGAAATGKSTSAAPTADGAGRQPCAVFFYLVSALFASVAVLLG